MNEKQLAKWLMDLAACYDYVPQKAAIATYLRILRQWKLSPDRWEELGDRALMRPTRKFPMPNLYHHHNHCIVPDLVNDPIVALSHSALFLARQLLHSG